MIIKSTGSFDSQEASISNLDLIDTHCHLDCEPLCARLHFLLANARKAGVNKFVVPGVHPNGWKRIQMIARSEPGIYPAYGIHPMHADQADTANLNTLENIAPQGIAIGEIGLDPSYPHAMEIQEKAFRYQLKIAIKLGLPVLVHCRQRFQQTHQILREEQASQVGGIMHAFSGSPEMAREFIKLGFAISLSGAVTWRNAVRPVRLATELPLDSLVLETDSPDMAPEMHRGVSNQPAWMVETLNTVAELRGMSPGDLATAILLNTRRVLKNI